MIYLPQLKKRKTISHDNLTVPVHNVRSLLKHVDDIVRDNRTPFFLYKKMFYKKMSLKNPKTLRKC